MKYGRRIRDPSNGEIQWCELTDEEVLATLKENASVNAAVWQECVRLALSFFGRDKPQSDDTPSVGGQLHNGVMELTRALFEQCGLKGFVALQQGLEAKVHWHKANGM